MYIRYWQCSESLSSVYISWWFFFVLRFFSKYPAMGVTLYRWSVMA